MFARSAQMYQSICLVCVYSMCLCVHGEKALWRGEEWSQEGQGLKELNTQD